MMAPLTLTALITPFAGDAIDWEALVAIADEQLAAGIDGLVLMGTTGEVFSLTDQEQTTIFTTLRSRLGPQFPIWWGCGHSSTALTIERVELAEASGADGAMIVTPPYVKPNDSGILRHFSLIFSRSSLPIMIYNNPSRAGRAIDVATLAELCQVDRVVAIKESGGNLGQFVELLRRCPPRVSLLVGDDPWIAPLMALGARGAVSVASNVLPRQIKELVDRAGESPELRRERIQRLWPLFCALSSETNPLVVKYLLHRLGWCSPELRPPLGPLSAKRRAELDDLLSDPLFAAAGR